MEPIVGNPKLLAQFEVRLQRVLGDFHWRTDIPWADPRRRPKHVGAGALEGVPIGDRKAEVFGHALAAYLLSGVIPFEGQRISAGVPFEGDRRFDFGKVGVQEAGSHNLTSAPRDKSLFNGLFS